MIDSASPLKDISLEAISVQLQTANGNALNIKLKNEEKQTYTSNCYIHTPILSIALFLQLVMHVAS